MLPRKYLAALILMAGATSPGARATDSVVPAPVAIPAAARANPAQWPAVRSPAALSAPATEAAISALLARMTLEQKVGQLIQADIENVSPGDLAKYPLGSILAGGNSGPYGNERADAATWRRLVNEFREASRQAGAGIPIVFGVDAVHGHSNLPGATIFPHNVALGAARDPALVRRIGEATAAEIAASGIEWTFAPTLAVPQDLRWGRSYEGYSADPSLVAAYAQAMTLGLQGRLIRGKPLGNGQVAATAKHFIADGGTFEGRDQGDARIDEAELVARHAAGYRAAIAAGALTVMASFSSWNGVKHHGNATLLTNVLKQRMGFEGLVVGDWNGHGQVPGCTVTHCPQAINAGIDLLMAPESWRGLFTATVDDVRAGRIGTSRLDDAVRRVLRVKFKLGLMGPDAQRRATAGKVATAAHLALAREAVAKSLVLLKNEGGVLPLRPGARVLIAGAGADNMAMQCGGWTITWQGTDTTAADFPNGQTLGSALAAAIRSTGGEAVVSAAGEMAGRPDTAVIITGETPYAEYQGDLPHLAYRLPAAETALVDRLRTDGVKVVVVFLSGRPLFTGALLNRADAFVAAWLPGTQGQGLADVLVARPDGQPHRDFTGRLPHAWPADARSPVASPLFPLGYGLDYRHARPVGKVNEDARIEAERLSAATVFFRRGLVPAPWYLATDGVVANRAMDLGAQEDARQFSWTGSGKISVEGAPVNLAALVGREADLLLDWRLDALPTTPVKISLGGAALDFREAIGDALPGVAVETRIPLRCFAAAGADLAAVGGPLRIDGGAGLSLTLRTVRVEAGTATARACPSAVQRER